MFCISSSHQTETSPLLSAIAGAAVSTQLSSVTTSGVFVTPFLPNATDYTVVSAFPNMSLVAVPKAAAETSCSVSLNGETYTCQDSALESIDVSANQTLLNVTVFVSTDEPKLETVYEFELQQVVCEIPSLLPVAWEQQCAQTGPSQSACLVDTNATTVTLTAPLPAGICLPTAAGYEVFNSTADAWVSCANAICPLVNGTNLYRISAANYYKPSLVTFANLSIYKSM